MQGIKKATPNGILQLMNVEGLTLENVANHLQKYWLYLMRLQRQDQRHSGSGKGDDLYLGLGFNLDLGKSAFISSDIIWGFDDGLLCCALFPPDYEVDRDTFVQLWMAVVVDPRRNQLRKLLICSLHIAVPKVTFRLRESIW